MLVKKKACSAFADIHAYLFLHSDCNRRECEGGSGINASCQQSLHSGGLLASKSEGQTRSAQRIVEM